MGKCHEIFEEMASFEMRKDWLSVCLVLLCFTFVFESTRAQFGCLSFLDIEGWQGSQANFDSPRREDPNRS